MEPLARPARSHLARLGLARAEHVTGPLSVRPREREGATGTDGLGWQEQSSSLVARRSSLVPPLSVRHPSTVIQCHRGRCWWWWLLTCLLLVSPCACALLLPLPRPSTLNLHCAAAQGVAPVRTTKADKQTSHSRAWFPLTTTTSFLNLLFSLTTLATHHPVGRRTVAHRCLQLLLQDSPCDVVCHFALDTSSSHGSSDIRGERSVQPAPQPDRHSRSAISQTFGTVGHLAS